MNFFYLIINNERRTMSAPFMPRSGDHIVIDNVDYMVDKVAWISNGTELHDRPVITTTETSIYLEHEIHAALDGKSIALDLARRMPTQKIQAIKNLRAATGWGLKEAKDMMDWAWATLNITPPTSTVSKRAPF